ncbi:MAG: acylphosphatase [bacterium]
MNKAAFHCIVEGEVQGVGYRFFAIRHANRLGIKGFVRNLDDGSVEVFAEGEREKLEEFLELLYDGPSAAFVRNIKLEWKPFKGEYTNFTIAF